MAIIHIESNLENDGSITFPRHIIDSVETSVKSLRSNSSNLDLAILAMTGRSTEQIDQARHRMLTSNKPRRIIPIGKTLADVVFGQWPGNETDEEIEAALRELS